MLVSLGLDFRRARLDVRERFHLEDADVLPIYRALFEAGAREAVLTRTCNRMEAYCWWPGPGYPAARGRAIARAWVGDRPEEAEVLLANARLRCEADAVRHLFRVAAGLESQILGDIHILGQLRRAFQHAVEAGAVGSQLHRLFETALRLGKRVKRETQLMATRSGVGSEAARRSWARWGGLTGRSCLVLGSGKIGTQAGRSLAALGAGDITVVNRTVHRAEKLARELGGARPSGIDELPGLLPRADVVIVATGSQEPVLTRDAVAGARGPSGAPLLVIDLSVPRNVEAAVGALPGVELVDLDRLHPEAADVEKSRLAAVPEAERLVETALEELARWRELNVARHALEPMQQALVEICRREVTYLAGDSESSQRTVERIVARVMAHPMTALREASQRGEPVHDAVGTLGLLFANARTV